MNFLERLRGGSALGAFIVPSLVFLIAFGATFGAALILRHQEDSRLELLLERRADTSSALLWSALDRHEETLFVLRDLFNHSDEVSRRQFEGAVSEVLIRHPEIAMIGWAPRIPERERSRYDATRQAEHAQADQISDVEPVSGRRIPSPKRTEYFPLMFAQPDSGPINLLGCDLASQISPVELNAARETGRLTACTTGSVFNTSDKREVLLILPVFAGDRGASAQVGNDFQGLLCALIEVSTLIRNSIDPARTPDMDIVVTEHRSDGVEEVLYSQFQDGKPHLLSSDRALIKGKDSASWHSVAYPYAGRVWSLSFHYGEPWLQSERSRTDIAVLTCGSIFSLLLAGTVFEIQRRSRSVERLVGKRTGELIEAQEQLKADLQRREEIGKALKASEERYRALIRQSSDAVWRIECLPPISTSLPTDEQIERILNHTELAECNEMTAQLHDAARTEDLLGITVSQFWKADRERHQSFFELFVRSGYRLADFECDERTREGKTRVLRSSLIGVVQDNHLVRIWATQRDMTKQRAMEHDRQVIERQLLETQRLESLGVLAGGIAHDFNNLLTGVLGHANLARSLVGPEDPLSAHLAQIERAAQSAAGLCQQMLAYAGKGKFVVKTYNLSELVSTTTHLLQVSIGKQAELRFSLADGLPSILADATQIQQVVMNLVINAAEAIGDKSGSISIVTGETAAHPGDFDHFPLAPEIVAPNYVYLKVEDTGVGMPREVVQRMFEPFFTTKFSGRGLGLAATLGIVRGHRGALNVESQVGRGTTFTVYLPTADAVEDRAQPRQRSGAPWKMDGSLLIIDDESSVREIAAQMGKSLGFHVITAPNGAIGVELFETHLSEVTAVLLDATMPGLSGEETLRALRQKKSDISVIMMSGYNLSPESSEQPERNHQGFLAKPFTLQEFRTILRTTLKNRR